MARVLLGVTGSVAAVRAPALVTALRDAGHTVKVVCTSAALAFFDATTLPPGGDDTLPIRGQSTVYLDEDEWPAGRLFEVGEPVLHIELRRWAEALLIAPLDANSLAKLSAGICDNLLTCVYRAWDPKRRIVLAPAMNTFMWEHPVTMRNLAHLCTDHGGTQNLINLPAEAVVAAINATCPHLRVVPPQVKILACGDEGVGGLAEPSEIVKVVTSGS